MELTYEKKLKNTSEKEDNLCGDIDELDDTKRYSYNSDQEKEQEPDD